jgi:hypothetical protein
MSVALQFLNQLFRQEIQNLKEYVQNSFLILAKNLS